MFLFDGKGCKLEDYAPVSILSVRENLCLGRVYIYILDPFRSNPHREWMRWHAVKNLASAVVLGLHDDLNNFDFQQLIHVCARNWSIHSLTQQEHQAQTQQSQDLRIARNLSCFW